MPKSRSRLASRSIAPPNSPPQPPGYSGGLDHIRPRSDVRPSPTWLFMQKTLLVLYGALCLTVASCTEATVIGGDQFDGTQLPVTITDTIAVELRSRTALSNLSNTVEQAATVAVGCLESAASGRVESRLGLELVELARPRLSLEAITIDSIVLVLPLVAGVQIGDTTAPTSLRVRSAAPGTIRVAEAFYNTPLETSGKTYGTFDARVPRRSGRVNTFVGDSIRRDSVGPQLRIPLNAEFEADIRRALAKRTTADTLVSDSLFVEAFPGIIVEGGPACAKTLPGVNLQISANPQLGVFIYYRQAGAARQFRLVNRKIGTNQNTGATTLGGYAELRVEYRRDPSGSLLERLQQGGPVQDSFAVLQALEGTNVEVTFPDLSAFGARRGVTFAELEVPVVAMQPGAVEALPAVVVQVNNGSGDLEDYSAIPTTNGGTGVYSSFEGGVLTKVIDPRGGTDSVQVYKFNITTLFQDFVSGARAPSLFLVPRDGRQFAGQSVLLGPAAGQLRTRLRIASTVLP